MNLSKTNASLSDLVARAARPWIAYTRSPLFLLRALRALRIKFPPSFLTIVPLILLTACAQDPFTREPLPELINPHPITYKDSFLQNLPSKKFILDETVIIQAPFRDDLAVLGELVVDRAADSFQLVGLTHTGVTLFKISTDHQIPKIDFAIPQLMEHPELLLAMAKDIHRIYFDLAPSSSAVVEFHKTKITFTDQTSEGPLVYEFGGNPAVLLEKRLDGFLGPVWRIQYFQYASPAQGLYPHGIVIDNSQFHYRIIVKNREMQQP